MLQNADFCKAESPVNTDAQSGATEISGANLSIGF